MKELEDAGCCAQMFNTLQNIGGSETEDTFQDLKLNTETELESQDKCIATICYICINLCVDPFFKGVGCIWFCRPLLATVKKKKNMPL